MKQLCVTPSCTPIRKFDSWFGLLFALCLALQLTGCGERNRTSSETQAPAGAPENPQPKQQTGLWSRRPTGRALTDVYDQALTGQSAVIFYCQTRGIYRITGKDLAASGVDISVINPVTMGLQYVDQAVPLYLEQAEPTKFQITDALYFYADGFEGMTIPYVNDRKEYFPKMQRFMLRFDVPADRRLRYRAVNAAENPTTATATTETVARVRVIQHNEANAMHSFIYRSDLASLLHTDYVFWKQFTYPETNKTQSHLDFPLMLTADQVREPIDVEFQLISTAELGSVASTNIHRVRVDINGTTVATKEWTRTPIERIAGTINPSQCKVGTNTLSIHLLEPGNTATRANLTRVDQLYLDWYDLKFTQDPVVYQNQERFFVDASPEHPLREIQIGNLPSDRQFVINLTRHTVPQAPAHPDPDPDRKDAFAARYLLDGSSNTLAISTIENCLAPNYTTVTQLTSLFQRAEPDTDFLVISHRKFLEDLKPFMQWKVDRGLTPRVVSVDHLYTEHTGGNSLSSAVRDYIRHVAESTSPTRLRYVLLVGDAIPIWMYPTLMPAYSYAENGHPANENYFANYDDPRGLPKVAVGRFSVKDSAGIQNIFRKIRAYEGREANGLWRARYLMIAASEEWARTDSRAIIDQDIHPEYYSQLLWSDPRNSNPAYHEQINHDLVDDFDAGNVITIFFGHGGGTIWEIGPTLFYGAMTKHLFDQSNVVQLTNTLAPPLVFALTCYTNDFDNPDITETLGETFTHSVGGAIGVIGAAQRTSTYLNFQFIKKFLHELGKGKQSRLGDIFVKTKQAINSSIVNETYLLLGDPTLEFSMPAPAIALSNYKREAERLTADYALPTSLTLPVEMHFAALDEHDGELLSWQETVRRHTGTIDKSLAGVTSASLGRVRVLAYAGNTLADFVGTTPLVPVAGTETPTPTPTPTANLSSTTSTTPTVQSRTSPTPGVTTSTLATTSTQTTTASLATTATAALSAATTNTTETRQAKPPASKSKRAAPSKSSHDE